MIPALPLGRQFGLGGWARRSFRSASTAARGTRETLAALPHVVRAVLVLPTLSEQLAHVARNTDALPGLVEQLRDVRSDTRVLPEMHNEFVTVRSTILDMRADTAAIAAEMPKLVVLERSLPAMLPMLEDLDRGVQQLAEIAEPLHGAARRVGRISDRLPQRNGNGVRPHG